MAAQASIQNLSRDEGRGCQAIQDSEEKHSSRVMGGVFNSWWDHSVFSFLLSIHGIFIAITVCY
jgi:hypothetical protein